MYLTGESIRVSEKAPHTIGEDFILPVAVDMAGTMLGEKPQKTIQTMPSSNNTISRRISDMAGDVLKQLLLHNTSQVILCVIAG